MFHVFGREMTATSFGVGISIHISSAIQTNNKRKNSKFTIKLLYQQNRRKQKTIVSIIQNDEKSLYVSCEMN